MSNTVLLEPGYPFTQSREVVVKLLSYLERTAESLCEVVDSLQEVA